MKRIRLVGLLGVLGYAAALFGDTKWLVGKRVDVQEAHRKRR
jgi:hypothetical protein